MKSISQKEIISILTHDGIGVLPTDTLYGLVGSALSKNAVARIYRVRKRNAKKPLIILINSLRDLSLFGMKTDTTIKKTLGKVWPGRVSVLLPCAAKKFLYLHRGTNMLAFRIPANTKLRAILQKTGPLVAPSANTEGSPPAQTIAQAQKYFKDTIDFYSAGGRKTSKPSTLIAFDRGKVIVKRQGTVRIKKNMIL